MDSDEDLPPLLPVPNPPEGPNEDQVPPLVPIQTSSHPPSAFSDADDDMPTLMSVSDSSDEDGDDASSFQDSFDDDQSEWEDQDDMDFDDDLPPLEHLPRNHAQQDSVSQSQNRREEGEDMPALIPVGASPSSNPNPPSNHPRWMPPRTQRHRAGAGLIPVELLESLLAVRFESVTLGQSTAPQELDLERAKTLVNGLERVSGGLLARMIRVGGAPGAYEEESVEDESVAGCPICWAPLLDDKTLQVEPSDDVPLPFASESDDEVDIVSLPCAHVFHSSCLLPWFSRKTSCPTCRFNIDPHSLTRRLPRNQGNSRRQTVVDEAEILQNTEGFDMSVVQDLQDDINAVARALTLGIPPVEGGDFDGDLFEFWAESDHLPPSNNHSQDDTQNLRADQPSLASRTWTLPDAPGRSLRERIEEKEREMGLRCLDATCIFGPTDDDPRITTPSALRQISIQVTEECKCKHVLHPACLVMSARIAGWKPVSSSSNSPRDGEDFTAAEVSCPSCRAVGTVSREDWEAGVTALAQDVL